MCKDLQYRATAGLSPTSSRHDLVLRTDAYCEAHATRRKLMTCLTFEAGVPHENDLARRLDQPRQERVGKFDRKYADRVRPSSHRACGHGRAIVELLDRSLDLRAQKRADAICVAEDFRYRGN